MNIHPNASNTPKIREERQADNGKEFTDRYTAKDEREPTGHRLTAW
ncbi:MAG: hypothetical protein IE936_09770 [Moraxella osloensis]|nr:hypothetical protein [Moraxella osloensis]